MQVPMPVPFAMVHRCIKQCKPFAWLTITGVAPVLTAKVTDVPSDLFSETYRCIQKGLRLLITTWRASSSLYVYSVLVHESINERSEIYFLILII